MADNAHFPILEKCYDLVVWLYGRTGKFPRHPTAKPGIARGNARNGFIRDVERSDDGPGDDLFTPHERRRGIPIGNLTSQFFANVYLNPFDHFVKEQLHCPCYLRYCDDFVIFGNDKRRLGSLIPGLATALAGLRLRLHERKCRVHRVDEGLDFLGYRIWPTHRRLRRSSLVRFTRRRRKLRTAWRTRRISLNDLRASMASWAGHAKHADAWRLREALADFVW